MDEHSGRSNMCFNMRMNFGGFDIYFKIRTIGSGYEECVSVGLQR